MLTVLLLDIIGIMVLRILSFFALVLAISAKEQWRVECDDRAMGISVLATDRLRTVYLKGLKEYPDEDCKFRYGPSGQYIALEMLLHDDKIYKCGLTRMTNQITGKRVFYHSIVIETSDTPKDPNARDVHRETVNVKCSLPGPGQRDARNHTIVRRNVLPAGFQEPEYVEITRSYEEEAPKPKLSVGVRQNGALVTGELNVSPGTPLQMEINLDNSSAPIYGLLVTHMQVTDTKTQEETIIFNGCSVDPYLFENFNTINGDFLTAKFRAFKFPESTYVQFRGTVNVCLDKCKGIECSDGVVGYGRRRRRSFPSLPPDPNKVFEITITSFIKVNYDDESENFEEIIKNQTKHLKNKKLFAGNQMNDEDNQLSFKTPADQPSNFGKSVINEELQYTAIVAETSSSQRQQASLVTRLLTLIVMCLYLFH